MCMWFYCHIQGILKKTFVADPEFTIGGASPKYGAVNLLLANFSKKLHGNINNWIESRACIRSAILGSAIDLKSLLSLHYIY